VARSLEVLVMEGPTAAIGARRGRYRYEPAFI
jgi:hypothetical protein